MERDHYGLQPFRKRTVVGEGDNLSLLSAHRRARANLHPHRRAPRSRRLRTPSGTSSTTSQEP